MGDITHTAPMESRLRMPPGKKKERRGKIPPPVGHRATLAARQEAAGSPALAVYIAATGTSMKDMIKRYDLDGSGDHPCLSLPLRMITLMFQT